MNFLSRGIGALVVRRVTGRNRRGGIVDPARFGIALEERACSERAQGILTAFFAGFEDGLGESSAPVAACTTIEPLFLPFYHEGYAMGCLPNGYLRLTSAARTLRRFEARFTEDDPYIFLRHVGVGFWLGFQLGERADKVAAVARKLKASRYRPLVYDGYGFQLGFFQHRRIAAADPAALEPFRALTGAARASAANGLGRSLWFFTMDAPERGPALARRLGDLSADVLGGLGLAAAFTFPNELDRAYQLAASLDGGERRQFCKGIRIALYVRHRCDPGLLAGWIDGLPGTLRARAHDDLKQALHVAGKSMHKDDFIEAFHRGCLDGPD